MYAGAYAQSYLNMGDRPLEIALYEPDLLSWIKEKFNETNLERHKIFERNIFYWPNISSGYVLVDIKLQASKAT